MKKNISCFLANRSLVRAALGAVLAVGLLLAAMPAALAVEADELLRDPVLEARARAISANLRCLVCQNESIDDSHAPLARDLRVLVREQLTAGASDTEVMAFLTARYGDFVLLRPRFTMQTLLLWLGPFVLLAATAGLLWRRRAGSAATIEPLSDDEARRIRTLLAEDDPVRDAN